MARGQTDTKQRILKAAKNLLSTHGCEGTAIDDVLTAAGVTKGAFYHYFGGKEALCEAVITGAFDEYRQLAESIDAESEPIEQLRWMLGRLAQLNVSGQWINCRLVIRLTAAANDSQPKIQKKLREFWRWYRGFFEDLITRCRDAGQLSVEPNAKTQAELLLTMLSGSVLMHKISPARGTNPLPEIIIRAIQT